MKKQGGLADSTLGERSRSAIVRNTAPRPAESLHGQEPLRATGVKADQGYRLGKGARVMGHRRNSGKRGGLTASVAAAALVLTGIPTAGFALDALGHGDLRLASGAFPFTPASVDPKLAAFLAGRTTGTAQMLRFTPAGVAEHG
jgi:hypothetical protein